MKINRIVPIITTNDTDRTKAFYVDTLGFKVVFDGKGYLSLKAPGPDEVEVSFMVPEEGQPVFGGAGITYCFQVAEVDAVHEKLSGRGLVAVRPLQDNPWGDRSFVILDPLGIALYFYSEIEPTDEFKRYIVD